MSRLRGRVGEALDAVKALHLKAQVRIVAPKRGAMRFRHQACTTAQERYPAVMGRLPVWRPPPYFVRLCPFGIAQM